MMHILYTTGKDVIV